MRSRLIITGAAIAAIAIGPAGAVAADHALNSADTVSVAAPTTVTPGSSSGSGSSGSQSYGYGYGSGSSGSSGSGGTETPGASTGSAVISGTPVKSQPGVVMVDTVLPGGEGAGTGMVLSSNGIILTNYHVVESSTSIRVTDANGKTYTAKVIGHDETHDIAVLKVSGASGMTTAKLDTAAATLGETVTAVGQGGGEGTLYKTSGTITGTGKQITASDESSSTNSETLYGLLQTNAQIVPGYSGGPLMNSAGEVVGMDTAASSSSPISGYAIPISSALKVANLIESGTRTSTVHIGARAAIGVEISDSSSSSGSYYGGSQTSGALVEGTVSGGAAAAAGITAGSTITAVGGHTITGVSQLSSIIDDYYPGQRVSVSWVDTSGQSHTATLTLGASSEN